MLKTLAWLGGSAAATFTHGPVLVVLVIFAAVVLVALVTTLRRGGVLDRPAQEPGCAHQGVALAAWRGAISQGVAGALAHGFSLSDGWYTTATSQVSSRTNGRATNLPAAASTSRAGLARW